MSNKVSAVIQSKPKQGSWRHPDLFEEVTSTIDTSARKRVLPRLPKRFRFTPLQATPGEIERLNKEQDRRGARRFEPTEKALERLAAAKSASHTRLDSWAEHPDERVAIALLNSHLAGTPGTKPATHIASRLLPRAFSTARTRREVWNPLLDALSATIWARSYQPAVITDWSSAQSYLAARLRPWIRELRNPLMLASLLEKTRSPHMIEEVARWACCLDVDLVNLMVAKHPPSIIHLLQNPHYPEPATPGLVEVIVSGVSGDGQADEPIEIGDKEDPAAMSESHRMDPHLYTWTNAYRMMSEAGMGTLSKDQIDRLLKARQRYVTRNGIEHINLGWGAAQVLEQHVHATNDQETAIRYIQAAGETGDSWKIRTMLTRSSYKTSRLEMTVELGRAAMEAGSRYPAVVEAISRSKYFRTDPKIRKRLFQSRAHGVMLNLAQDAKGKEALFLLKRLLGVDADAAYNLLERNREYIINHLTPIDLAPLLKVSDRRIRLEAIAIIGELAPKEETRVVRPEPARGGTSR